MRKIIATAIAIAILCSTVSFLGKADAVIEGNVNVEVKEWLGVVYPKIEIENQSITFGTEIITDGEETTYLVNDTLIIPLHVVNESNRTFVIPRAVFYSVIIKRSLSDAKILPIRGFLKRMFPVLSIFKSVNVIKGMLGKEDESINVTLNYKISNTTFENGENLTMIIFVMGFLPGDLNGLSEKIPFIAKKQVTLNVSYIQKL